MVHFSNPTPPYTSAVSRLSDADPPMDRLRVELAITSYYCYERMDSARIPLDVSCNNRER